MLNFHVSFQEQPSVVRPDTLSPKNEPVYLNYGLNGNVMYSGNELWDPDEAR